MFTRICRLLWLLLHFLVQIYDILRWLSFRLEALALWSYDLLRGEVKTQQTDRTFLEHCKKQLSKLPKHLIIIIAPEAVEVNKEVLSRLFQYALTMNIEYISVCDVRSPKQGYVSINKVTAPKGVQSEQLNEHHRLWHVPNTAPSIEKAANTANGHANGYKTASKTIQFCQTSIDDGRPLLADICRQLFENSNSLEIQKLLQNRTELSEYIDAAVKKSLHNFPDPELGIIFNSFMCLYGLQPWQTRFTEFHTINPSVYFNAETFATVLYKFSQCERRWGK